MGLLLTQALSLQADLCVMTWLLGYVDPSDPHFVAAVLAITFNPLFWNVVSAMAPAVWMVLPSPCLSLDGGEPSFLPTEVDTQFGGADQGDDLGDLMTPGLCR